jgi:hypothetical protein
MRSRPCAPARAGYAIDVLSGVSAAEKAEAEQGTVRDGRLRVQRIGQVRDDVHILSLRYAGTVEDQVYATLSSRFGDIFSVLGQLPDGFEDQWIDAVLRDRDAVKNFSQRVEKERPPMELRYMRDVADDRGLDWEYTERVLSSRDLDEWMRQGW